MKKIEGKFPRIAIVVGLAFFMTAFFSRYAFSATLRVPTAEYPTIQSAIDAADILDIVLVANGTYKGGGNKDLDFKGKTITVKSENGPANCIIDCEGAGRGFYFDSGEGPNAEVSGFTIRNGYAEYGGGIYIFEASPTISNCIITDNEATGTDYSNGGGGISVYYYDNRDSYPRITNCTITKNTAYKGGGLFSGADGGTVTNCTITNNTASYSGGGIYSHRGFDAYTDCTISGNYAEDQGAGIFCYWSSANFNRCTIQNNRTGDAASDGGGVYVYGSSNTFTNCIVTGNSAYDDGGGFYLFGASPTITNCTVSGNSVDSAGGGIYFYNSSSPKIWNSIFWGNTPNEFYVSSGTPEVHYCDVQGGYSGSGGNIDADPLFVGGDNFRLSPTSPCINTGGNIAPELPTEDKDGNWRILDVTVDIGAYEYGGNLTPPTASTGATSSVSERTATLNGTLNPNGFKTQYHFQFGTTTAYGMVTPTTDAGSGTSPLSPSNTRVRLRPNTTYHYRLAATNGFHTVYGSDQAFTTLSLPPSVTTRPATAVNSTQPTLNGSVNANGKTTTYWFEYGTTTAYGNTTAAKSAGAGTDQIDVFTTVTGLSQNTLYHYRTAAQNGSGTSYGVDKTFTTAVSLGNTLRVPEAYATIQAAIDAATTGDTVLVAAPFLNSCLKSWIELHYMVW